MKVLLKLGLLLPALALLTLPVAAVTYVDYMNTPLNDDVHTYQSNLRPVFFQDLAASDRSQLAVQPVSGAENGEQRLLGWARYQVQGATSVTLRIYSPMGTYVMPDLNGVPQLGIDGAIQNPSPQSVSGAHYNLDTGALYYQHQGAWLTLQKQAGNAYAELLPAPAAPSANRLVNFGVNLYTGTQPDGARTRQSLRRVSVAEAFVGGRILVAEDFVCTSIPEGTRYLWVELNDLAGGFLSTQHTTSLAWVSIEGAALAVGPAAELSAPEPPPSSSLPELASSSQSAAQSSRASSAPLAAAGGAASKASSAPKEASAKFEGVITSSQPSSKTAKPASSKASGSKSASVSAQAASSELEVTALEVYPEAPVYDTASYQAPAKNSSAGMIIYILLACAAVLFLLLRPKDKAGEPQADQKSKNLYS